jgi:hypothetical protein
MTLAYPQIYEAVSELIGSNVPGSPNFKIYRASKLGIAGTKARFGAVQVMVNLLHGGRAVILGFLQGPEMHLCVDLHKEFHWDATHRFVCIVREAEA